MVVNVRCMCLVWPVVGLIALCQDEIVAAVELERYR